MSIIADSEGCGCTPAWPELVVHTEEGRTIPVQASDTPGGLACLYYAHCARCGARYPGAFRVPPRKTSPRVLDRRHRAASSCRATRPAGRHRQAHRNWK